MSLCLLRERLLYVLTLLYDYQPNQHNLFIDAALQRSKNEEVALKRELGKAEDKYCLLEKNFISFDMCAKNTECALNCLEDAEKLLYIILGTNSSDVQEVRSASKTLRLAMAQEKLKPATVLDKPNRKLTRSWPHILFCLSWMSDKIKEIFPYAHYKDFKTLIKCMQMLVNSTGCMLRYKNMAALPMSPGEHGVLYILSQISSCPSVEAKMKALAIVHVLKVTTQQHGAQITPDFVHFISWRAQYLLNETTDEAVHWDALYCMAEVMCAQPRHTKHYFLQYSNFLTLADNSKTAREHIFENVVKSAVQKEEQDMRVINGYERVLKAHESIYRDKANCDAAVDLIVLLQMAKLKEYKYRRYALEYLTAYVTEMYCKMNMPELIMEHDVPTMGFDGGDREWTTEFTLEIMRDNLPVCRTRVTNFTLDESARLEFPHTYSFDSFEKDCNKLF